MNVSPDGSTLPKSSRWRNWAIGCGTIFALVVLVSVLTFYWAVTPGPQVPSGSFLGSQTIGVAHLQDLRGDPAVQAMTGAILRSMHDLRREQVEQSETPFFLRWLVGRQGEINESQIDDALRDSPRDATVQLESVAGFTDPQILSVVNLSRYPRALRFAYQIGSWVQGSELVAGYPVLKMGSAEPSAVAFVEDTLLWGQRPEVLQLALERRRDVAPGEISSRVLATFANRQERWNLFGTLENRQNSLAWVVDKFRERWPQIPERPQLDELLSRINQVDFGLDVADEDSLEGFLDLVCGSPREAEEIAGLLSAFIQINGPDPHFALQVESNQERVRVFLQFKDFAQFAVGAIRKSQDQEQE